MSGHYPEGLLPSLESLLAARETRWHLRRTLAEQFKSPVLSLTLRLPHGLRLEYADILYVTMAKLIRRLPVICRRKGFDADGPFGLAAVKMPSQVLKRRLAQWESSPIGTLFDADVTDENLVDLSRRTMGLPPRPCLVCGDEAKLCVVTRRHGPDDVRAVVERILRPEAASSSIPARIGALARLAAEDEIRTFPKPGLVTPLSPGSHKDMDVDTMLTSSDILAPYWMACAEAGFLHAAPTPALFSGLRRLGLDAERTMLSATGGVNTHKGLVFSLGILCAAAGALVASGKDPDIEEMSTAVRKMTQGLLEELSTGTASENGRTAGEQAFARYGLKGARGQAVSGFPMVAEIALPAFDKTASQGLDRNSCRVQALLALMAHIEDDTNLVKRGGPEGLSIVRSDAKEALDAGGVTTSSGLTLIGRLERTLVEKNLSPGGCADMLALTCFLDRFRGAFPKR